MNANLLRRVNWLWKHRHTHDDEDFQEQITVIRQTVEEQTDDVSAVTDVGAHLHLVRGSSQTIAVDGEALEMTAYGLFERQGFGSVSFPATEWTIQEPGYYNVSVEDLEWDTYTGGGTIQIIRVRDGNEAVVREWTTTYGRVFDGVAHAIPCESGDKIKVVVDHDDASTHDISGANLVIYLVDTTDGSSSTAGVVDKITSTDTGTTHTVAMTSAQQDGDLMLMFLVSETPQFSNYPAGWSLIEDNRLWGNSSGYMSILYKESDGTETDVTVDTTASDATVHAVWVIRSEQDYSTATPDAGTALKVEDNTIDPPSVSVSHGTGTYLSFVLVGRNGGSQNTVTTSPDNYSEFLEDANGGTDNDPALNIFDRRVIISSSEDPTSVTIGTNWTAERMGATTVAVRI